MQDLENRISRWVEEHRDDYIRDVSRLVAIRSVSGEAEAGKPFGQGPAAALEEAMKICREKGFRVTDHEGYVMTADLCAEESALDILAHLDVVGEGEGWDTDPYTAVEKDGCLYGRGTDDDKGPAVAAIYAMACVAEQFPLRKNVRLILGTDEESGSRDIRHYYASNKPAPNTFSPDANFPVYNTEKGGLAARFTKSWPKRDQLPRVSELQGGYRINVLPADARATILGLERDEIERICLPLADQLKIRLQIEEGENGTELRVKGLAAHASTPEQGINGITALIRILLALPLAEDPGLEALRQLDELMPHGDSAGKTMGIAMEDEISGPLTLAFSLLKMDDNAIEGSFDSRVPICATEENCRLKAKAAFEARGFTFDGFLRPPHHTPADSPFIRSMLQRYSEFTGRKGECLSMGGGTYVHDIPGGVAFGAAMPEFESNLHGANERMKIADMLTAIKIFAAVICDLCT